MIDGRKGKEEQKKDEERQDDDWPGLWARSSFGTAVIPKRNLGSETILAVRQVRFLIRLHVRYHCVRSGPLKMVVDRSETLDTQWHPRKGSLKVKFREKHRGSIVSIC